MGRSAGLLLVVAAAACNALNGAGDLAIGCPDCDAATRDGGADGAAPGPDGGTSDAAVDAAPLPCQPGPTSCNGDSLINCVGGVEVATPCAAPKPVCVAGACAAMYPSCGGTGAGTALDCGPATGNRDCCASLPVPGGTFNRRNDTGDIKYNATISPFKLDRFEVTVGRFRAFVDAGKGLQATAPASGAAAHPKIAGSGWNTAWNTTLPVDLAALRMQLAGGGAFSTWTDAPGANEVLPITNVNYFLAFAFCAWDGGRLPTETEQMFAMTGGNEQRQYPWGAAGPDYTYAIYNCAAQLPAYDSFNGTGCAAADIVPVGSRSPKGDGRFGQVDLAGSVAELVLDKRDGVVAMPCFDCARVPGALDTGKSNIALGGSYRDNTGRLHSIDEGSTGPLNKVDSDLGIRCAR